MIPEELKDLKQWVFWKTEVREEKPTKVPYDPKNRQRASTTDKETWGSLAQAMTYREFDMDGFGFVFSPDDAFCGIDFDNCIDKDGNVSPEIHGIIESFDSYTEVSPSGRGLHLIIRGTKPGEKCRVGSVLGCKQIEIYDADRYFTFTGGIYKGHGTIKNGQKQLKELYALLFKEQEKKEVDWKRDRPKITATDDELLKIMFASKNGEKIKDLWEGKKEAQENDDSKADMALVSHLSFYTGGDKERIDRMFRKSKLCRKKWTEREDYRKRTIDKSVDAMTEFYTPRTEFYKQGKETPDIGSATFIDIDEEKPEDEAPIKNDVSDKSDLSFIGRYKNYHNTCTVSPLVYAEYCSYVVLSSAMGYDSVHKIRPVPMHHTMMITLVGPTTTAKKSTAVNILKTIVEKEIIISTQSPSPEGLEDRIGVIVQKKKTKDEDGNESEIEWIEDKEQSLIINIEEISRIIQGMSNKTYTSGLAELLCSFYDAGDFVKLRSKRELRTGKPNICIIATCTPNALKESATSEELVHGGALARMMFVYGDADFRALTSDEIDITRDRDDLSVVIKNLRLFCKKHPFVFSLTQDGLDCYNELNKRKLYGEFKNKTISGFAARSMEYVLKVSDCHVISDLLGITEIWNLFKCPERAPMIDELFEKLCTSHTTHTLPSENGKPVLPPYTYINNNNKKTNFTYGPPLADGSMEELAVGAPTKPISRGSPFQQEENGHMSSGEVRINLSFIRRNDNGSIDVVFGKEYIERAWLTIEQNIKFVASFIDYILDEQGMARVLRIVEGTKKIISHQKTLKSSHMKACDFRDAMEGLIDRGDIKRFAFKVASGHGTLLDSMFYCAIKSKKRNCSKCQANKTCDYSTEEEIIAKTEIPIENKSSFVVTGDVPLIKKEEPENESKLSLIERIKMLRDYCQDLTGKGVMNTYENLCWHEGFGKDFIDGCISENILIRLPNGHYSTV